MGFQWNSRRDGYSQGRYNCNEVAAGTQLVRGPTRASPRQLQRRWLYQHLEFPLRLQEASRDYDDGRCSPCASVYPRRSFRRSYDEFSYPNLEYGGSQLPQGSLGQRPRAGLAESEDERSGVGGVPSLPVLGLGREEIGLWG